MPQTVSFPRLQNFYFIDDNGIITCGLENYPSLIEALTDNNLIEQNEKILATDQIFLGTINKEIADFNQPYTSRANA